ncbi:MAG: 4-(cytidine 5'-diphospho)-2-C-methyl-D-erythritol kinase, partial [Candidatus Margulisbacteria bacterium]|nr:4-(cytidine 5'-diphospho)-2-C-methyl-D-erythritol kinase [Candidatus Margulisiibacteriota bacterium]
EFDRLHLTVSRQIKNDLEQAVMGKYPVIANIKEELMRLGCQEAQMSGSGPTVFGIIKKKNEAERIYAKMKRKYPLTFIAETVDRGVETLTR